MSEGTGTAGEQGARDKMAAMQGRAGNAEQVNTIAKTGSAVSTAGSAATMGYGAAAAYGTGGIGAVACYAAPLAAGIAGVWAGAKLANALKLDEKVLDLMGKPKLAQPGPEPATKDHDIAHNHAFGGALGGLAAGLLAGIVVGALAAAAIAGTVLSGGLLGPIIIAAAAGFGGSLVGAVVSGIGSKMATVSGKIMDGSPDVFFEGKPVARVTDPVSCDKHSNSPKIAEGSETIFINDLPLARIGHKITCSAVVQQGCKSIKADNTTGQYGPVDAEMSAWEQAIVSTAEVALSVGAIRFRSSKLGKRIFGEPIDPSDGGYVDFRTDFEYAGILPLALTRVYSCRERVEGLLGSKWICNWSQRLVFEPDKRTALLDDGDGESLQFPLGVGPEFNSRHLKAPHYLLTGTKQCARLFDSRTQQTLTFSPKTGTPDISILTSIEDRNGNRAEFIYHENRLQRIVHSDGTVFFIKTTPEGNIETLTRDGDVEPLVRYRYDATGAITDVESLFNGEFHYGYTTDGWLNHWRDSGATRVDLEYDGEGRVIATRTPEGLYNDRFIYSPEEHKTRYIDATGACSDFWFNENDLMVREIDPLGNTTFYEWDGLDRKLSTTDPLGRVTRYDYNNYGHLTGETDWAGRATSYKHDEYGQLTEIGLPDGGKASWEYDGRGNLVNATEPDGTTFRFGYDGCGRLLSETGPDGAVSRWVYDLKGRLAARIDTLGNKTSFEEDSRGRLSSVTDASGHTTRYHYDHGPINPRADLIRVTYPDGGEESFSYDKEGLLATHTGAEGQITSYSHGAFDLLRTVVDAKGFVTSMEYDGAARLICITNAAGQKWKYGYDLAGRLAVETDWAGRETHYVRDAVGRVTIKRLPDGVEQRLTWDERDRIISVETPAARFEYLYDPGDRLVRAATYNYITCDGEPETDIVLDYDDKGRLAREIQNGKVIEYRYDEAGRCTGRKSPTGETSFAYDRLGLLTRYESNGHGLEFRRNALGLETERRRNLSDNGCNAFGLIQSYDPCGRLKTQFAGRLRETPFREYLPPDTSPALEMAGQTHRNYRWDKSGRLMGVHDNARGTRNYKYDVRDQITEVRRPTGNHGQGPVEKYGYDALMNLALSGENRHEYKGDLVTRVGRISYGYDQRGRVIEKRVIRNGFRPETWRYKWDDFDRLTEAETPEGALWRYTCDAFGRRVKKECVKANGTGGRQSISYIWQGATLAEEWKAFPENGQPTEVSRWHFEPGTFNPVAKETLTLGIGTEKAGEARFFPIVTDHMGTPKEIFDEEGVCLWQADHGIWGRMSIIRRKRNEESHRPEAECPLRFQNQWEDDETGLYYNLHRYYDPDSGQYLSQDPIGLEGGFRTHGYVHDPMQWVDPWGLKTCASKLLSQFKGKTHALIKKQLVKAGFNLTKKTSTGNETWTHPDGSIVRVDPYGNAKSAPWKTANNAHVHKYDTQGNPLNDRGIVSNVPSETHIGIDNPPNLPTVRNRPHGAGTI